MSDSTGWPTGPMAGFDTETTGADPRTDRIVSAAFVVHTHEGMSTRTFLLDPGIDIPTDATRVHGITTEHARSNGSDYRQGVQDIAEAITEYSRTMPIVGFNVAFDLTLVDSECRRLGIPSPELTSVLDSLVMDRIVDRARKGKRRLSNVCQHYGVSLDNAHAADADARAALLVAQEILRRFPPTCDLPEFHRRQQYWRAVQESDRQASLREWYRDRSIVCEPGWPTYDTPLPAAA